MKYRMIKRDFTNASTRTTAVTPTLGTAAPTAWAGASHHDATVMDTNTNHAHVIAREAATTVTSSRRTGRR